MKAPIQSQKSTRISKSKHYLQLLVPAHMEPSANPRWPKGSLQTRRHMWGQERSPKT